jgi:hypothetical protein
MDRFPRCAAIAALVSLLAACGGGSSSTPTSGGGEQPQAVTGVSTPSSVSVVTPKNPTP